MASRLILEPSVFNSGKTRHYRSKDFTSVPRLERPRPMRPAPVSLEAREGRRDPFFFRLLRWG